MSLFFMNINAGKSLRSKNIANIVNEIPKKILFRQPEFKKISMIGGNLDPIHEDVPNQNTELQASITYLKKLLPGVFTQFFKIFLRL